MFPGRPWKAPEEVLPQERTVGFTSQDLSGDSQECCQLWSQSAEDSSKLGSAD